MATRVLLSDPATINLPTVLLAAKSEGIAEKLPPHHCGAIRRNVADDILLEIDELTKAPMNIVAFASRNLPLAR